MILSGKTIGELALSTGITSNSLFPIEQSGFTFHIPYSGLSTGGGTYEEVTYDELYSLYTGGTLTPGGYYLMTDFQTCYDQPNFNNVGDPIVTGNYKTGNTEPLLLLATSTTGFSPTVYSTLYPQDKITYDINWNTTEVTSSPAKGRITERIDEKNNRADYDFRAVQFIRYEGFFSEQLLDGSITIDPTGLVTGFTTFFNSDFVVGDILGVYNNFGQFPIGSFGYFEITSITSDTEMYVTGTTIPTISDTYYSRGISLPQHMSPFLTTHFYYPTMYFYQELIEITILVEVLKVIHLTKTWIQIFVVQILSIILLQMILTIIQSGRTSKEILSTVIWMVI